jgi:hypothetical protein
MATLLRFFLTGVIVTGWMASAVGQSLTWQTSKSAALTKARNEGKLVMLLAGRTTCGNCAYMKSTVCESVSPAIRSLIQCEYVPWFCDVDSSQEWQAYASGLGSFTLPMICCIDPKNSATYLDRTTSIQEKQPFYTRLLGKVTERATNAPLNRCAIASGKITISVTNLVFGKSLVIERSSNLQTWTQVGLVGCQTRCTNWSETIQAGTSNVFYKTSIR